MKIDAKFTVKRYAKEFLKQYPISTEKQASTVAMFAINGYDFVNFKDGLVNMIKLDMKNHEKFNSIKQDGEVI
jgi:hypothetical protein